MGITGQSLQKAPLLEVAGLDIEIRSRQGHYLALRDVSFSIGEQETLGLVGESGSGKTLTALAILRLLPDPPTRVVRGSIKLGDRELLGLSEKEMRRVRGEEIGMVFQEPLTSLDPVSTIGAQMRAAVRAHRKIPHRELNELCVEMLERVRIPRAKARLSQYPHELSGGMRQRVLIGIALSLRPKLLLADEPTTAVDVTVQAEILRLLAELQEEFRMAILFISHNLGVVSVIADRVAVMYAGQITEELSVDNLVDRPLHPYTRGLLLSIPSGERKTESLRAIPGTVPPPGALPVGCPFHPRCEFVRDRCRVVEPELMLVERDNHRTRCLRWSELPAWR